MKTIEKVALAITGLEFVGLFSIALLCKNAIDNKVQIQYVCKNAKEFLDKCERGEIKFKKRFVDNSNGVL